MPLRTDSMLGALLSLTLVVGILGVAVELVLLGHYEEWQQWLPFTALGVGLLSVIALFLAGSAVALKAHIAVMVGLLLTGLLGIYFHYGGNVEFEREMVPSMSGMELFREAMTGATPALAPGAMALLGIIGLVLAYQQHTLLQSEHRSAGSSKEREG